MFSFLKTKKKEPEKPSAVPANTVVYAIGDIHGRFDLLKKLHNEIVADAKSYLANTKKIIVYIGDYIDRGVESFEVIEHFINEPLKNFDRVFIKGNHEDAMLKFMEDVNIGELWLAWGGYATVQSYGVSLNDEHGKRKSMANLQSALINAIPKEHLNFYHNLEISYVIGDYVFVHAGIKPGIDLGMQESHDMMTIREDFIYANYPCKNKTVVFGHTIFEEPFHISGKISIDTGAYATGKLTAVVLKDTSVKFIST